MNEIDKIINFLEESSNNLRQISEDSQQEQSKYKEMLSRLDKIEEQIKEIKDAII